uniref:Protein kinase domain-containing protein n=1 Tax=Oryza brachyantha TaxID=4533 RepID=J3MWQ7_ORYBR
MALLVCFAVLVLAAVQGVVGQKAGFLSIDCGLEDANSGYKEERTGIVYVSDGPYVDSGENHRVSPEAERGRERRYATLRSFPSGVRNCYSLPTVAGAKYLVRARSFYGNYDGANSSATLQFDLYLGVNYWDTVYADRDEIYELLFAAWASWAPLCLLNTGRGTPFVSFVELRTLGNDLYHPDLTASHFMSLYERGNLGSNTSSITRYPDDPYDRFWWQTRADPTWRNISTTLAIEQSYNYAEPTPIAQTAVEAAAAAGNDTAVLTIERRQDRAEHKFMVLLHFADFQNSKLRQFTIVISDDKPYLYTPAYLKAETIGNDDWYSAQNGMITITLAATNASKLPPMLNAFEIYTLVSQDNATTFPRDFDAIMAIKLEYGIKKNWMGDPCFPEELGWEGVKCSIASGNNTKRIISLFDSDIDMCNPHRPAPRKKANKAATLAISVVVPVIAIAALVLAYLIWRHKTKPSISTAHSPRELEPEISPASRKDHGVALQKIENRRFTYKELENLTDKFERFIGQGGFGLVYYGRLEDGTEVAVKMRSESSSHGLDEFFAEVQSLTMVHHRNLVSLVGYCWEKEHFALVYEYMPGGSLYDHLRGNHGVSGTLDWRTRVRVVIEAAQGLDYLHKGCSLPIIHRDVKTQNILLGHNLQAKIADFGLCKTYLSETQTHISVAPAGSAGYMDPEYYHTGRITESSDVYSFGVVLLEIVTGESPIQPGQGHIIQRVKKKIASGNISLLVDTRLRGAYEVSSIWKVVDTALRCTDDVASQRPTMAAVIVQLKESLALEEAWEYSGFQGSTKTPSETTISTSTFAPSAR